MGPDFERIKGRGMDKKFIAWLTQRVEAGSPRFQACHKGRDGVKQVRHILEIHK